MILWTKFSQKALFLIQSKTNEHHHQVQDIRINLGNNFHLNLTALILWIKYAQKMSFPSKAGQMNMTIELSRFELDNQGRKSLDTKHC